MDVLKTISDKDKYLSEQACMYYAISWYGKLKNMPIERVKQIAEEAGSLSEKHPLHMMHDKQFTICDFEGLSGLQCVSLLAVSVDILSGGQISKREMAFKSWLPIAKLMEGAK